MSPRVFVLFSAMIGMIIVLAVLVAAARLVGSKQQIASQDLLTAITTNPDGSRCHTPCMFGVQPGITKVSEALDVLRAHPYVHIVQTVSPDPRYPSYAQIRLQENMLLTFNADDQGFVYFLNLIADPDTRQLSSKRSLTTLGDVFTIWGSPDQVALIFNPTRNPLRTSWYFYPASGLTLVGASSIGMGTGIVSIDISEAMAIRGAGVKPNAWKGFRSRYPPVRGIGP